MQKPKISIVVAVTRKDAAIGNGGKLLFRISDDLKRFKTLTKGHPVIMGRKTYESIGHPLPERTNIVITRNPDFKAEGVIVASSIQEAIEKASLNSPLSRGALSSPACAEASAGRSTGGVSTPSTLGDSGTSLIREDEIPANEVFIIGGGEIYKQALPYTDKLYLTIVESDAKGDVFFPNWHRDFTKETFREERTDPRTGLKYTWIDLKR